MPTLPVMYTQSGGESDIEFGKTNYSSGSALPVPIPGELEGEFSDNVEVRNYEFWKNGKFYVYSYGGTELAQLDESGNLIINQNITIKGNQIKSSGGTTAITLSGANITVAGNVTSPGIGTFTQQVVSNLGTFSNLSAPYKLFDIPHPSPGKEHMRLKHASLEGPEIGVYVRGKTKNGVISLPNYWKDLVDENSITVHLTPTNVDQHLFIKYCNITSIEVWGHLNATYHYYVVAERKDVPKLEIETDA
jgi:hypothetical protein